MWQPPSQHVSLKPFIGFTEKGISYCNSRHEMCLFLVIMKCEVM